MKRCSFFAFLGLVACGPNYDHTTIDNLKGFVGDDVTFKRVYIVEGTGIKAHIESFDSNDDSMTTEIVAADASLIDVTPTITEHDYLLSGLKAGRTEIQVKADGKLVLRIDALVEAQPTP